MDMDKAFPSKYLKAADCPEDGDLILTIKSVKMESIGMGAEAGDKPVVYFEETHLGLVLNKVNTATIKDLYGRKSEDWEGERIALFEAEVEYQGKRMPGIRVRLKAPKTKAKATKAEPVAAVNPDAYEDSPF